MIELTLEEFYQLLAVPSGISVNILMR